MICTRELESASQLAQEQRRHRTRIHLVDNDETAEREAQRGWVTRIKRALSENRFCLYQQSIMPIGRGSHYSDYHEVLIRLVDEDGRLIPPGDFIPAAERFNVMSTVDRWVVRTTLAYVAEFCRDPIERGLGVWSINLSSSSLCDEFRNFVRDQIREFGVPPECVCFEITEPASASSLRDLIRFIEELKVLGCMFALDDFGSGLCSFTYLNQIPVDFVKIDGRIVKGAMNHPLDRALVEVICRMVQIMGIEVIAEGVDDLEMVNWLQTAGVGYAQGYALERPHPIDWGYGNGGQAA